MIRLVVNAENFGDTSAGDDAIVSAHHQGIVTSTAVVGTCTDLSRVVAALRGAPRLGMGLSLALTGADARPISPAGDAGSLLTADGRLRASPRAFAYAWLKGEIGAAEVEREMEAQLVRVRETGLPIDHLCTRDNLGFLPGIGTLVERLARRHKIAGIRSTVEAPTLSWVMDPARGLETGVLAGLSWLTRRRLGPLRHGPRTWGYLESGRLDEVRIIEIVGRLEPGGHELICHPASTSADRIVADPHADRHTPEWRALTSIKVKTALERRGIVLCRWQDLF